MQWHVPYRAETFGKCTCSIAKPPNFVVALRFPGLLPAFRGVTARYANLSCLGWQATDSELTVLQWFSNFEKRQWISQVGLHRTRVLYSEHVAVKQTYFSIKTFWSGLQSRVGNSDKKRYPNFFFFKIDAIMPVCNTAPACCSILVRRNTHWPSKRAFRNSNSNKHFYPTPVHQ